MSLPCFILRWLLPLFLVHFLIFLIRLSLIRTSVPEVNNRQLSKNRVLNNSKRSFLITSISFFNISLVTKVINYSSSLYSNNKLVVSLISNLVLLLLFLVVFVRSHLVTICLILLN